MPIMGFQLIFFLLFNCSLQSTDASNLATIYSSNQAPNSSEEEGDISIFENCISDKLSIMFICILNQTKLHPDNMKSIILSERNSLLFFGEFNLRNYNLEKLIPFLYDFFDESKPIFNLTFKLIKEVDENNKNMLDYIINIVYYLDKNDSNIMDFILENFNMLLNFPGIDDLFNYIETSAFKDIFLMVLNQYLVQENIHLNLLYYLEDIIKENETEFYYLMLKFLKYNKNIDETAEKIYEFLSGNSSLLKKLEKTFRNITILKEFSEVIDLGDNILNDLKDSLFNETDIIDFFF